MEFINFNRKDVGAVTTASTGIKNVKSITGLKLNLDSDKRDMTFSGLGSYLEIDVKNKGTTKKVKIPFFSAYKKDKFVNIDGYAFVNPLAKKVIEKVLKHNTPEFELTSFQADATSELNDRINALGTTPADLDEKARLEDRRDNVIATAIKKDSDKLVREEIKYLENVIDNGVNIRNCTNDNTRKAALTKYADQFERLATLKAQVKKFTWSQKRGLKKLNNKFVKRIGAGLAAVAVAAGLVVGKVFAFPKNAWENIENWFNKPKVTVTQTVKPAATKEVTIAPTNEPTPRPIITVQPTAPKNSIESEMLIVAKEANYRNFEELRTLVSSYGFNYDALIEGYTFVEHAHEIDTSRLSKNSLDEYINNARALVAIVMSTGSYQFLPLRAETFETMQDCLNGNPEAGIYFVSQACESKEPLLDMIAIGELESELIFDQQLLDFNINVYFKEIDEYKNKILNGLLEIASLEPAKVKKLGTISKA